MANLTKARFSANSVEYETPAVLFAPLDAEFHFTLDGAASAANAKCAAYFTSSEDGLAQPWAGVGWCNPPWGRELPRWLRKAKAAAGRATTVMPARTNTTWGHEECRQGEIRFIRGRPRFNGGRHGLPFPLALVIFRAQGDSTA